MKAIDTNVLVRIVIKDNEQQSQQALSYVTKQGEVFISFIVLCEFAWVCTGCYDISKPELINLIESILRTTEFVIENPDVAWMAIHEFKKNSADFSDCLIASISKHHGCDVVATFDKKAARSSLFEKIA